MQTNRDRVCVDRVIPSHLLDEARAVAVAENPENARGTGERLALEKSKKWKPGRTLRVRFLDGSKFLHEKTKHYASEWTKYANLNLTFGDDPNAEIRVAFGFDPGRSWSGVGTDCLVEKYFPRHEPTMNFGWFTENTDEEELSRVIIHEFGHAFGCVHEHQNPDGGIKWNEEAVLKYFEGAPNFWDEATIRFNVLDKYKADQLNGTKFDPDSIMLYAFPAAFTNNAVGTHENNKLSTTDINFIKQMYPGR